jgi:hypothetical protein
MSASADQKHLDALVERWKAAPHGSKQRRHLRRAVERAVRAMSQKRPT